MTRPKIMARRHKPYWRHRGARRGWAHKRVPQWPVPDRGAKGKTRKNRQWSKKIKIPKLHKIIGYGKDVPAKRRHGRLVHEVIQRGGGKKGTLSTFRTLGFLRNVNPDKETKKVFKTDANWLGRKYGYKIE